MDQEKSNPQEDELDTEFKQILCVIRQYIPYINSNVYLSQCRVWLEKLSTSEEDKMIRNVYLGELCRQIRCNKLIAPFTEPPQIGQLRPIGINSDEAGGSSEKLKSKPSLTESAKSSNSENWDYAEWLPNPKNAEHKSCERESSLSSGDKNIMGSGEPSKIGKGTEGFVPQAVQDDSWSDLTEASLELRSRDFEPCKQKSSKKSKRKMKKMSLITEQLQPDTESDDDDPENDSEIKGMFINLNETPLEQDTKFPKHAHYISRDWKHTIGALQLRLSEMSQQNNELKMAIKKLEKQMEEDEKKHQAQNDHNLSLSENLHVQELAKLKETHAKNLLQLNKTLTEDYQDKLREISTCYEEQIFEMKRKHDEAMSKKQKEISRLSEIIQNQCLRIMNDISALKNSISNCSCDKKVHVLKKCVSKMEKIFNRSEQDYLKHIEHLKQELELKENALQVQLKLQKADLIAQTRTGQKEEFEQVLNSLEVKYIKMLEAHEQQIVKMKKLDDAKIFYLTELLEKHGIKYNDYEYNDNH